MLVVVEPGGRLKPTEPRGRQGLQCRKRKGLELAHGHERSEPQAVAFLEPSHTPWPAAWHTLSPHAPHPLPGGALVLHMPYRSGPLMEYLSPSPGFTPSPALGALGPQGPILEEGPVCPSSSYGLALGRSGTAGAVGEEHGRKTGGPPPDCLCGLVFTAPEPLPVGCWEITSCGVAEHKTCPC